MLKRIKKGIKLEQVYTAVKMCQQAGMIAHESFIIGLPGETKDTLLETDEFAKSTKAIYGYHFLAPFPGTTVREKIQDYDLEIITDNWTRYDANDAIVKTSSLLPQDMREFGAGYDEEMEADWNKIVHRYNEGKGTLEDKMQVEGNWRMKLTYHILKNDIIEKCGFIEPVLFNGTKESALNELCRRVIESANTDAKVVDNTIRDFAGRGYLKTDISDKGCQWSWATS
jgi:anaerobic magnesium-protoporphyrin IX monomethyl ester cyclase